MTSCLPCLWGMIFNLGIQGSAENSTQVTYNVALKAVGRANRWEEQHR